MRALSIRVLSLLLVFSPITVDAVAQDKTKLGQPSSRAAKISPHLMFPFGDVSNYSSAGESVGKGSITPQLNANSIGAGLHYRYAWEKYRFRGTFAFSFGATDTITENPDNGYNDYSASIVNWSGSGDKVFGKLGFAYPLGLDIVNYTGSAFGVGGYFQYAMKSIVWKTNKGLKSGNIHAPELGLEFSATNDWFMSSEFIDSDEIYYEIDVVGGFTQRAIRGELGGRTGNDVRESAIGDRQRKEFFGWYTGVDLKIDYFEYYFRYIDLFDDGTPVEGVTASNVISGVRLFYPFVRASLEQNDAD